MSRGEIYPWQLLTEVGDYFMVPESFKPFSYVSRLVSQKNYRDHDKKFSCTKMAYGSIVMLAGIEDQLAPYEFVSAEGVMSSTSKRSVDGRVLHNGVGQRLGVVKRTIPNIVAAMSPEVRGENLPWWYDPVNKKLLWNGKIANAEDTEKYMNGWRPHPDAGYPDHYNLDENLIKRPPMPAPEIEEEEEDYGEHPIFGDEEQVNDE